MAENNTKIDRLHDQLPKSFNTRENTNWSAILSALGSEDERLAQLLDVVKDQFFVQTAARPYLDSLGSNSGVARPRMVGMEDSEFRSYIPIMAYKPKQVKDIIDELLNQFFFRDLTTSRLSSSLSEPFALQDTWTLRYSIDGVNEDLIIFSADDFSDISNATAAEVASAINRQAQHSFAVTHEDSTIKETFIRIFTNTVGAKGSISMIGGRGNIGLQFDGFNTSAGNGIDTEWTFTKIGDLMAMQYTAGSNPSLSSLSAGSILLSNLTGNKGSFVLENVDTSTNTIFYRDIFGTVGVVTQTSVNDTKFLNDFTSHIQLQDKRSIAWEVSSGEIVVEMPTTPAVVRRSLKGSTHLNGSIGTMTSRDSGTQLTIDNATLFPDAGKFLLNEKQEIITRVDVLNTATHSYGSRGEGFQQVYLYTGKSVNTLTGITPDLPSLAQLIEVVILSATRVSKVATITTSTVHGLSIGQWVTVANTANTVPMLQSVDGNYIITSTPTSTTFTYVSAGDDGAATGGLASSEQPGMSNTGSRVVLHSSRIDTGILGATMWDTQAPFVLSSVNTSISDEIQAGNIVRNLTVGVNEIVDEQSLAIFDFGTEFQEGPVKILYKPTDTTLALDPAYIFQYDHEIGSALTMIRRRGAHSVSTTAQEYPAYITDPSAVRVVMEEIIRSVKSVGMFIDFLVRFPDQAYATVDVYNTGEDPG